MEARLARELPAGPGWRYERKWDGFRCLTFRDGESVRLQSKSGKPLERYFPEVAQRLLRLPAVRFCLDGELIAPTAEGASFEDLQARLHPAQSRIDRLARQSPAALIAFDCLHDGERSIMDQPLAARREALERLLASSPPGLELAPGTLDDETARGWLQRLPPGQDGVVAKRLDGVYEPGERAMVKVKLERTADCVVGGFRRQAKDGQVGALLLGLFDDADRLNHVGHVSALPKPEREEISRRLESLAGGPGFTGAAPGGPSRWSSARDSAWTPVRWELVAEVAFDHVSAGRFRHGVRLVRWRPDKAPRQCRCEQLGLGAKA